MFFRILVGMVQNKDSLIDLSKEDVEEKILFTGNIDNMDVKKILAISNFFVITSDKSRDSPMFLLKFYHVYLVISTNVSDIKILLVIIIQFL